MRMLLFLAMIYCGSLVADTLDVRIEPKEPLVNENFKVVFEIKTEDGTDPIVNFNPLGAQVVARSDVGMMTRTTYINGRLTTERTLTVVYEMLASRAGTAYLRDINVELNGKTLRHETISVSILSAPRKARDVFVRAELNKEEVFVGESILARYYLYNKTPVMNTEVRKFPTLEKFLKRYHQEPIQGTRVVIDGETYTRRVIYTAQLYAETPGSYTIDPITLSVQYSTRPANPFDSFGLGGRYGSSRTVTLSSPPVDVTVKALPVENVPSSFTGLVGKHNFSLELNKNRFMTNEPIELKLKVDGPGALELYEAPSIFAEPGIEEFEATSDLAIREDFTASKTFLYTYLGRKGMELENKRIPFTYFNPDTLSFETEYVELGDIVIARGAAPDRAGNEDVPAAEPSPTGGGSDNRFFEPVYKLAGTYAYNSAKLALILAAVCAILVFYLTRPMWSKLGIRRRSGLLDEIASSGLTYSRLRLLAERMGNGSDMRDSVRKSELSESSKSYLLDIIEKCESHYDGKAKTAKENFDPSYKVPRRMIKEFAKAMRPQ